MAVAANRLVGEAPLVSPELALVDAELAAELRRTLSPVEDSWLRPPARVEDASAESEKDASAQLESVDDSGHTESRDAEQLLGDEYIVSTPEHAPAVELRPSSHDPVLPAPEPGETAFEDSPPRPEASFDEASVESEDDAPAQWDVADILRETEPRAGQLLVDEYIVAVPEGTPVQEQRSSHYPVLPAPEPEREAIEETDAALRRIRERLNESNESPARKGRLRRAFTLASGVIAMCALGVFAVDAQLQVGQLPSWLPF